LRLGRRTMLMQVMQPSEFQKLYHRSSIVCRVNPWPNFSSEDASTDARQCCVLNLRW
jgi:hypothetical protein